MKVAIDQAISLSDQYASSLYCFVKYLINFTFSYIAQDLVNLICFLCVCPRLLLGIYYSAMCFTRGLELSTRELSNVKGAGEVWYSMVIRK